jgi:hypothetical protein
MDLTKLTNLLAQIDKEHTIVGIDLYGGELFTLPDVYLMKLLLICKKYVDTISIVTNFTIDKQWIFDRNDIDLGVSWDYIFREKSDLVFENIKKYKKPLGIILTSPDLYSRRYEVVEKLNSLDGEYYVDIKPCMPTSFNNCKYNFKEYQEFVLFMMSNLKHKSLNYMNLKAPLHNNIRPHIFINPDCEIQKLVFDELGEKFETTTEINFTIDPICAKCNYRYECQTEHDSYYHDGYDCIGMKKLIEIYNKLKSCPTMDWRKRRTISYIKNSTNFGDTHLDFFEVQMDNDQLFNIIIKFFETKSELLYPAKSYYVAIIYAWLLNKYFGEDIRIALNYADLLNYDDMYFVRYDDNKDLYDRLIEKVIENLEKGVYDSSIEETRSYFNKEFIINE